MPHLELIRDEDRDARVLAAAGDLLDLADVHSDPTEAGRLVAEATRLIHVHRRSQGWVPPRASTPLSDEQMHELARDEQHIDEIAEAA